MYEVLVRGFVFIILIMKLLIVSYGLFKKIMAGNNLTYVWRIRNCPNTVFVSHFCVLSFCRVLSFLFRNSAPFKLFWKLSDYCFWESVNVKHKINFVCFCQSFFFCHCLANNLKMKQQIVSAFTIQKINKMNKCV